MRNHEQTTCRNEQGKQFTNDENILNLSADILEKTWENNKQINLRKF